MEYSVHSPWIPSPGLPASSQPIAPLPTQVRCDEHTRFTVIAPRLIRAEYVSDAASFEDRPTLAVINRDFGGTATPFTVANDSTWCNITVPSSSVNISYRKADGEGATPFVRHALTITAGSTTTYTAGDDPREGNLGGTLIALSGVDGGLPLNCTGITSHGYVPSSSSESESESGDGFSSAPPEIKSGMGWGCTLGVASRSGWALVNDTFNGVIDPATDWLAKSAALERSGLDAAGSNADLYFFLYGNDYRAASRALSDLSGRQPVPPRHSLGVAWSRYEQFSAAELRSEVTDGYLQHGIPLDNLNLDTGWHQNFCFLDELQGCDTIPFPGGGNYRKGYGGLFEWDETLFPFVQSPAGTNQIQPFVAWLQNHNLSTYLDVHHCPGIWKENRNYETVAKAMGFTKAQIAQGKTVPIHIDNRTFVEQYFNSLLEQQVGKENLYYWIDYCMVPQGYTTEAWYESDAKKGRHNYVLWWLWLHYNDMERRMGRGSNLAWYGGLGTQRYPIGHSGDIIESWASLKYQPLFTSTAANVNFGYWSHDLGGHRPASTDKVSKDEELYTRWLQLGTFFPTLRSHMNRGISKSAKRIGQSPRVENVWLLEEPFATAASNALRYRARLIPYIYTSALTTYETGVSLVYPLYFDYPSSPSSYDPKYETQFLFGHRGVLVAPIVTKCNASTNLTSYSVLLPKNKRWIDIDTLQMYDTTATTAGTATGERIINVERTQSERGCVLVEEGTVIPMSLEPAQRSYADGGHYAGGPPDDGDGRHPLLGGAAELPRTLVWETYIGNATSGGGVLMEDDAKTNAYKDTTTGGASSAIATTIANFTTTADGKSVTFTIHPTTGMFEGMKANRNYEVRLKGAWSPTSVSATSAAIASGKRAILDVAPQTRPNPACGKVLCSNAHGTASWWWDATTLTAFARVDNVAIASESLTVTFTFATSLFHVALHAESFPTINQRVLTLKRAVDLEYWRGARPSRPLNNLLSTADRMQNDPASAVTELQDWRGNIDAVVKLHNPKGPGGHGSATNGLPSEDLQTLLRSWLAKEPGAVVL